MTLDFLGIGAQKAGTTWIFEMLRQHPDVAFPAGKEVHFWDDRTATAENMQEYKALFSGGKTNGEITPAYGFLEPEKIALIADYLPNLKLIYMIRNPIDRAWSSARMALKRSEMNEDEASDQWFIDHFRSEGSLKRGDYEECLKNWWSAFSKSQLKVFAYDDVKNAPRDLLNEVCKHIGVDSKWAENIDENILKARVHSGKSAELRPALKAELEELYLYKMAYYNKLLDEVKIG